MYEYQDKFLPLKLIPNVILEWTRVLARSYLFYELYVKLHQNTIKTYVPSKRCYYCETWSGEQAIQNGKLHQFYFYVEVKFGVLLKWRTANIGHSYCCSTVRKPGFFVSKRSSTQNKHYNFALRCRFVRRRSRCCGCIAAS